jgi:alpha-L-fucosidase
MISRRRLLGGAVGLATGSGVRTSAAITWDYDGAKPTSEQLAWQQAELSLFLHFGINTFTDREWGEGAEDPRLFNPVDLDAAQWAQTAKDAGFKYAILTAKHHDGFCLWPTKLTEHCVRSSPWQGGKGDVVGEFVKAFRAKGIKIGLYLSPWDRHEQSYGDSPSYNRFYIAQLTELLTQYGEIAEVWFDGANGEGPNGKRQVYDWQAYYSTIKRLQPKALIAITGPDIRWVGNEDGFAAETEWSIRKPDPNIHLGTPNEIWWPAECDVSIRPGWFWHPIQDAKVKPLDQLIDIYFRSVGRNSVLLMNVPPNTKGLIADSDVARLREWRTWLDATFKTDFAQGKKAVATSEIKKFEAKFVTDANPKTYWSPEIVLPGSIEIDLGRDTLIDVAMIQENVVDGQRIGAYRIEAQVDGAWRDVSSGTTIGYKKLDRFDPVKASRVKLTILSARGTPQISKIGLFKRQDA